MSGWISLASQILSFLGFLLLSLGLLRSKQRIQDETRTYWGYNPFSLNYAIADRPAIFWGLIFTLTGFGIGIVDSLSVNFPMITGGVWYLSIIVFLFSWLLVIGIGSLQERLHDNFRQQHFYDSLLRDIRSKLAAFDRDRLTLEKLSDEGKKSYIKEAALQIEQKYASNVNEKYRKIVLDSVELIKQDNGPDPPSLVIAHP